MKKIISLFIFCGIACVSIAQNVGIGTPTPDASAQLDISANKKGVLIPRMTKADRNLIASPANGLLVFQSGPDSVGFYYYNSGSWVWLQNSTGTSSGWSTTGNTGTDTSVNFIGTKDYMPLRFKFNNQNAGLLSQENTAFGFQAFNSVNNSSLLNTAFGHSALIMFQNGFGNVGLGSAGLGQLKGGNTNIGIGFGSMALHHGDNNILISNTNGAGVIDTFLVDNVIIGNQRTTTGLSLGSDKNVLIGNYAGGSYINGGSNVAVGDSASGGNTTGHSNVAIGAKALAKNTIKSNLVAIGDSALFNNGIGATTAEEATQNVAIGSKALYANTTGLSNTAVGFNAQMNGTSAGGNTSVGIKTLTNNNGTLNTAVGHYSMFQNLTGAYNTATGSGALQSNTLGSFNASLGFYSLFSNSAGNSNTAIGNRSLFSNATGYNNTAIGDSALLNNITGFSNVAIGKKAGSNETGSNKLYIENSNANKDNALIYGDFAADSLNLNAKVNIRDFTRLGTQVSGAPAIKMKKMLIPIGPAVDGVQSYPMGSGITDAKVLGVEIFVVYASPWKIPASYRDAAGYEFNYQVQSNNIVIINKAGNSANIGGKPFTVLITYEE